MFFNLVMTVFEECCYTFFLYKLNDIKTNKMIGWIGFTLLNSAIILVINQLRFFDGYLAVLPLLIHAFLLGALVKNKLIYRCLLVFFIYNLNAIICILTDLSFALVTGEIGFSLNSSYYYLDVLTTKLILLIVMLLISHTQLKSFESLFNTKKQIVLFSINLVIFILMINFGYIYYLNNFLNQTQLIFITVLLFSIYTIALLIGYIMFNTIKQSILEKKLIFSRYNIEANKSLYANYVNYNNKMHDTIHSLNALKELNNINSDEAIIQVVDKSIATLTECRRFYINYQPLDIALNNIPSYQDVRLTVKTLTKPVIDDGTAFRAFILLFQLIKLDKDSTVYIEIFSKFQLWNLRMIAQINSVDELYLVIKEIETIILPFKGHIISQETEDSCYIVQIILKDNHENNK